MPMAQNKSDKG